MTASVTTFLCILVIGCMSLEEMAPPVDEVFIALAGQRDIAALERGREVYFNRCIGCHSIEPIGDYTVDEWRIIMAEMAPEAKLNETQTADLMSYLSASTLVIDGLRRQALQNAPPTSQ